jgi:hypothetical protein
MKHLLTALVIALSIGTGSPVLTPEPVTTPAPTVDASSCP